MFVGDATVSILGVADVNPWAPGIEFARRFNIPVTTDLREFVTDPRTDLIIDVTGSPEVHQTILRSKPAGAEVMGGLSARFVWDLLAERKRTEELEDRYSLVVRELQAQEGDFIIGQNPKMREIAELVARVAPAPTTVLVRGESGTGKELVARALHKYSPVRVIADTNRDLATAMQRTEFREDLFYRFNAFTITLPGLRERMEDLPVLAYHFLRKAEAKVNKKVERISTDALDLLKRYPWPGNLRELENIIERAVVLTRDRSIEPEHLPLHLQESRGFTGPSDDGLLAGKERLVREFERQAVLRFLRESRGNISAAAKKARITRRNFHRLLLKHRISAAEFRSETVKSHQ